MKDNVYRQILEDSPLAYTCIKVIWGEDNTCESIKLVDINKSFENIFNISQDDFLNKEINYYLNKKENLDLLSALRNTVNSKHTISKYLSDYNMYINIDIYNYEKNEYHVRCTKITNDGGVLSTLLKKSPFIAWAKDRDGKYIDVNDKYLDLIGANYEDIIGNTAKCIWNDDMAKKFEQIDSDVVQNNKLYTSRETLKLNNSNTIYVETAKWPYTDITGNNILGSIGVCTEITDKVKLRESLQRNEQNFLDLTNNIDEVIIIRDKKKALYINPYFEELYGFKPDELYEDIYKWYEYWDEFELMEQHRNRTNSEITTSILRIIKYGKIDKWINVKSVPLFDEHGNFTKEVITIKDVTNKKKLENELEDLRLEFFANLSHELRTPINLIMSSLQVIYPKVNNLDEINKEYLTKYLNILSQNNLRLLKLANNLIDSTKINSNNFDYNPTNQDIVGFVEDICTSVVEFVKRNNMEIIFDTDTEEQIAAFDLNHMERILLNLLSNAIKFNKQNGKIEVHISIKDNIKISVKDEGIGIPKDKLDTVFGRFEQVNKNIKREREGSGIGLSLVKSLVEMHNGQIYLDSTVGEGSEFSIILPNTLVSKDTRIDYDKIPDSLNKISKMEIEFSDIYL